MGKYATGFGPPPNVTGESNHYNRRLGKCIVDVQTVDKNGTAEFVLDAYEQSDIMWCLTRFTPKEIPAMKRTCMDSQNEDTLLGPLRNAPRVSLTTYWQVLSKNNTESSARVRGVPTPRSEQQ